ncbi:MAG: AraC family transcriptional regulator [Verrucomicrobiota bacterium]|nr:AraC family transcriptional regulator [Verrucomicrobiota bacterium]
MRESGIQGLNELIARWSREKHFSAPDNVVVELTQRILAAEGDISVAALCAGLGLSYRQILRRFYEATGLTPKEFARLRRLRHACVEALRKAAPAWADLSAATGFSDQAHMTREFQDIYGWTPRLVHEYLRRIEHRDTV